MIPGVALTNSVTVCVSHSGVLYDSGGDLVIGGNEIVFLRSGYDNFIDSAFITLNSVINKCLACINSQ